MNEPVRSWPFASIDRLLDERLPDPLRDPALDLAVGDQRVHHSADVVDCDVAHDLHDAGLRLDLHLGDLAAVRPGLVLRGLGRADTTIFASGWLRRELEEPDAAIGAADHEPPGAELDVPFGRLERAGRELAARVDDRVRAGEHRAAADLQRPRAAAAAARSSRPRVALDDRYLLGRDPQSLGDDLRVGGPQARAHRLRARHHDHACPSPVTVTSTVSLRVRAPGHLDVAAERRARRACRASSLRPYVRETAPVGLRRAPCRARPRSSPQS